jgi:ribonuclease T2
MKLAFLAVVLFVCAVSAQDSCQGDDYGTAGVFDFYVFTQSWSAGFCQSKGFNPPGCMSPTAYMQKFFTIHGLWPNYAQEHDGHEWPQCCDSPYGPDVNATVEQQLHDPLHKYWPDENAEGFPNYDHSMLLEHEWNKHGTCSGLDQYSYYTAAMNISVALGTPAAISNNVGGTAQLADIYSGFGAQPCTVGFPCDISIDCANAGLMSTTTCWKKDMTRMTCPGDVITKANCPDTVTITGFSSMSNSAETTTAAAQQLEHTRDMLRHRMAVLRRSL